MTGRLVPGTLPIAAALVALAATACSGEVTYEEPPPPGEFTQQTSNLSTAKKRERANILKRVAASEGLTNPVLLAGIAEAETKFAHCWSEATWACKGPHSSTCDGPVIAGSGDGPCSDQEGGLGMFQFDGGTYRETLERDGREVLTLEGNVRRAVDFVADMVQDSTFIDGVDSRSEAIDWMNQVDIGGERYQTWIKTVTAYYNGCFPGRCSIYDSRSNHYDNNHRRIYSSLGAEFWSGSESGASGPERPEDVAPNWVHIGNDGTVDLEWTEARSADSYTVAMEVNSGDQWRDYYEWETDAAPFRVWPQTADSYYRWRLKACNLSGCSNWSDWRAFAVGNAEANATLDGYDSGTSSDSDDGDAGDGSTDETNDSDDTSSDNSGNDSAETTPSGPPSAPSAHGPDATTVDSERAELTWGAVDAADTYTVNMRVWNPDTRQWRHYYTWSNVDAERKSVWPADNRRTYAWRVRACRADTCSPWSAWSVFLLDH